MNERELMLQQAHEACLQRSFSQAYAFYKTLLQKYPDDSQVLLEYGKAVFGEFEDPEQAIHLFERALASDPGCVEALLWLADTAALGYGPEQAGAVTFYRKAMEFDPQCVDAYIGLGLQYQAPGVALSLDEAIQAFRQAIALDPRRADAHQNLGIVLLKKGDKVGARAAFSSAIELLEKTNHQQKVQVLRKYLEQIDRNEVVRNLGSWNDSPRYSWLTGA